MYGLVNKGLQDFVTTNFGKTVWETIRLKAGVKESQFIGMQTYSDELTYNLANSASIVLNIPLNSALEAFGEYWILYTAQEGYADLIDLCGKSVPEFLRNLNQLHARIRLTFPELNPPSIVCSNIESNSLILHYHSERPGLSPMVVGLLKGLGKRLSQPVQVTLLKSRESGHDHEEFEVRF